MGKAAIITAPFYLGFAWSLLITYQIFTSLAVNAVLSFLKSLAPSLGSYLLTKFDLIVFIHSFAWIFLISSVIPSRIFGKERSVFLQFLVCLILSLSPLIVQELIPEMYYQVSNGHYFNLNLLFNNYFFSFIYLIAPYVLMTVIDMSS